MCEHWSNNNRLSDVSIFSPSQCLRHSGAFPTSSHQHTKEASLSSVWLCVVLFPFSMPSRLHCRRDAPPRRIPSHQDASLFLSFTWITSSSTNRNDKRWQLYNIFIASRFHIMLIISLMDSNISILHSVL